MIAKLVGGPRDGSAVEVDPGDLYVSIGCVLHVRHAEPEYQKVGTSDYYKRRGDGTFHFVGSE